MYMETMSYPDAFYNVPRDQCSATKEFAIDK